MVNKNRLIRHYIQYTFGLVKKQQFDQLRKLKLIYIVCLTLTSFLCTTWSKQCDQIGPIFTYWVLVFFRQYFKSTEVGYNFGLLFSTVLIFSILTNWDTFWVIFSQTHRVTLVPISKLNLILKALFEFTSTFSFLGLL
jgi:hypothetical protein